MAIRIEGAALVLRREQLDRRWPGGAEAFIEAWDTGYDPTLSFDDDVVAIGLYDVRGNDELLEWLAEYGLAERFCHSWRHVAIVDEEWGPVNACDWLDFVRTENGSWVWMPPRLFER